MGKQNVVPKQTRSLVEFVSLVICFSLLSGACQREQAISRRELELPSDPVRRCRQVEALLGERPTSAGPIRVDTAHKQLFLDNYLLARLEHVKRKLHQPKKYGPVIRADQAWEDANVQIWGGGPFWSEEEQVWKLWYVGRSDTLTGYAVSKDGIHWEKPTLNQVRFRGSTRNNVVAVDPTLSRGGDHTIENIIYHPEDPDPQRRYKGFMGLQNRKPIVSLNGLDWRLLDAPSIPSADVSDLFYDQSTKLFIATLKHPGPYGRSFYLSVSRDFEHWTDPRDCLIVHADKRDQKLGVRRIQMHFQSDDLKKPIINRPDEYRTDIYRLPVFRYEGIYIGLPTIFNQSGRTYSSQIVKSWADGVSMVELAVSRDLIHWERVGNREKFIPLSPLDGGKNYDTGQLLTATPVINNNQLWFYYTALKWRAQLADFEPNKYARLPDNGAIGLARLRLDGFVSLDAGETEGFVITKPLLIEGRTLHVNLAAPGGEVRAEFLDADGKKAFPGFSLEQSIPATGDSLDSELKWGSQKELSSLAGKTVCIRFALRRASLYAFWVKN